jgi:hypothetical protein
MYIACQNTETVRTNLDSVLARGHQDEFESARDTVETPAIKHISPTPLEVQDSMLCFMPWQDPEGCRCAERVVTIRMPVRGTLTVVFIDGIHYNIEPVQIK